MGRSTTGLAVGLVLGLAAAAGGFWGFLITAILGAAGWAAGAVLDGRIDVSGLSLNRDARLGGRDGFERRDRGDGYDRRRS